MPILDMPLSELQQYQGRNPCPADIDAFWDASVKEMETLGTAYELSRASFQVPGAACYDMYFIGVGGARIHCKLARPAHIKAPLPALCYFHGYASKAPDFFYLLPYVQAGFAVAAMDCRGQAGESEDVGRVRGSTFHGHIVRGLESGDPSQLLFRQIFLDTAQLARIMMAMPEVDPTRVGALGGSQGGGLTLACAELTPTLNRIALMQAFLCDYQRVWEMDLAYEAYAELRDFFRQHDPQHAREKEIFTLLGYIDNQHLAHRIKAKTLWQTGLMDNVCPPSSQFATYNKITAPKDMLIYPDFRHERLPEGEDKSLLFMLGM